MTTKRVLELVSRWEHGDQTHRQWLRDVAVPDVAKAFDEVRREILGEAFEKLVNALADSGNKNDFARGIHHSMDRIHQMIRAIPETTTSSANIGGVTVVTENETPPARLADRDTVLRTLAQAYVGDDYTVAGREFRDAVGRLWRR